MQWMDCCGHMTARCGMETTLRSVLQLARSITAWVDEARREGTGARLGLEPAAGGGEVWGPGGQGGAHRALRGIGTEIGNQFSVLSCQFSVAARWARDWTEN